MDHSHYFQKALELAQKSFQEGGVPIGAILVSSEGSIISEGHNENKQTFDPTAHAEIVCMRKAGKQVLKKYNDQPTILYTTLEPCFACGFFVTRTNISKVIWALNDPYNGGIEFLRSNEKLVDAYNTIQLVAEPLEDIKNKSKKILRTYYLNKGDDVVAKMFE